MATHSDQSSLAPPEQLRVPGLTGVDVALEIAGPGSRSYAFVIDWHIRLLLAVGWFALAWLALDLTGHLGASRSASGPFGYAIWPALLLYFFYHPVLEVLMGGRTPGKRIAKVCIVTRHGGAPSVGALLLRNVFRLIDCLPAFYLFGLGVCIVSARRIRIGDMAAGTVLVMASESTQASLARLATFDGGTLGDPRLLEIAHDLLGRWRELGGEQRVTLARALLMRARAGSDVATLDESALRARVQALLGNQSGVGSADSAA